MMVYTIKNWGIPDGIAGTVISTEKNEAFREASKLLFYKMGLSIDGGYFELFKEKQHTKEDVEKAKNWIRKHHDVVNIKIVEEIL
jgi:hypothetical protein